MAKAHDTNEPAARHSAPRASGARLGRYLILGTLARGGMGEVLRARAIGAAGATKEVCIKRIRESRLRDRGALERFVHEARLSLALTHANIVATFDFGRAGRDHYLAMEWIDGADLGRILRDAEETPLSASLVAHVGAEIARALRYAHAGDARDATGPTTRPAIVHCDVKPSNILVSRSGDVKLADFGVAVARLDESRGGTPRYMAPEVRDGGSAGPEADLYALGVVLGDMLLRTREPSPELTTLAARLVEDAADRRPSASEVVTALEELGARERLAGAASPRDELGERAARSAPSLEAPTGTSGEPSELDPDASYLRDGESDLETRLTVTTRSTPEPPQPTSGPTRSLAIGVAIASALALAAVLAIDPWGARAPGGDHPQALAPAPLEPRAEIPTPPAQTEPSIDDRSASAVVVAAPPPEPPAEPSTERTAPPGTAPAPTRHPPRAATREPASSPRPEAPAAELPAPVEPAPPPLDATLRINAIPWANVELDGRPLGATPLPRVEVAPGAHTLVLTNPVLGITRTEHVDVEPGERRDVIVTMR